MDGIRKINVQSDSGGLKDYKISELKNKTKGRKKEKGKKGETAKAYRQVKQITREYSTRADFGQYARNTAKCKNRSY